MATRPGRVSLMRTAVALMGEHGYEGTSTRDIANAAGVSVAALYYHFPSKLDLLREFLHEAHDVVLGRVEREIAAAGPTARDKLDAAVATLVWSNIHDNWARQAALVAWREHGRLALPDQKLIAKKRQQLVDMIQGVLEEGVAAGEFSTTEPREVARAVLTLCISVAAPFPEPQPALAKVFDLHQRLAAALADTPSPS
ncbi:MAG TPA: TetR/AcrR family transcriptional regulator [Acidimicrobiales bacterium]